MFKFLKSLVGPCSSTKPVDRRTHLGLEQLEERALPTATYIVLDFTPDYHQGSLLDTFAQVRTNTGYSPRFFDFNGDGRITNTDVDIAAQQIANKVAGYFSPFRSLNVSVLKGSDVLQQNFVGKSWLDYGLKYSNVQTAVMYIGGHSPGGEFGRAPVARSGTNVEGFGETYSRTIAEWMARNMPAATPNQFAAYVASTTAHEIGHMFGLQHATSGTYDNVMRTGTRNTGRDYFVNASVNTETGYQQNGFQELNRSFAGQSTYYQYVNYGLWDKAPAGTHDEGEGEHHHDETVNPLSSEPAHSGPHAVSIPAAADSLVLGLRNNISQIVSATSAFRSTSTFTVSGAAAPVRDAGSAFALAMSTLASYHHGAHNLDTPQVGGIDGSLLADFFASHRF